MKLGPLLLLILLVSKGCSPASQSKPPCELTNYSNFLQHLETRNFEFWSFRDFLEATTPLPGNLVVLRHDIHLRDIRPGYEMANIEMRLLRQPSSTFFVMKNIVAFTKST